MKIIIRPLNATTLVTTPEGIKTIINALNDIAHKGDILIFENTEIHFKLEAKP